MFVTAAAICLSGSPGLAGLPVLKRAEGSWDPRLHGPGPAISPESIAASDDRVYVAGEITSAGSAIVDRVAAFDPATTNWSSLPLSGNVIGVGPTAVLHDDLYIVVLIGDDPDHSHTELQRWDGENTTVLLVLPQTNLGLQQKDDSLYVFGDFKAGDLEFQGVGRWDGESWHTVPYDTEGAISLAPVGGDVYVRRIRSPKISGLSVYDGATLTALDNYPVDTDYEPSRVLDFQDQLYAFGDFRFFGPELAAYAARWDGTQWRAVGDGPGAAIEVAVATGAAIYVVTGHPFDDQQVRRWDGLSWTTLGEFTMTGGFGPYIKGAAVRDGKFFVTGDFTAVDGEPMERAAYWDPADSAWHALQEPDGLGLNAPSTSIVASDGGIYAGGEFTTAGGAPVSRVARWTGSGWEAVGSAAFGPIAQLLAVSDGLVAIEHSGTGLFTPQTASHWDGSSWTPIPLPDEVVIEQATTAGDKFYIAARSDYSHPERNRVFVWDGKDWTALPSRMNDNATIFTMSATVAGDLFVAGRIKQVDGVPVANIALWDGERWSSMGTLDFDYPLSVTTVGNALFVAGEFTAVDGLPCTGFAKWEDGAWSAVGDLGGTTSALAVDGKYLYAIRNHYGDDDPYNPFQFLLRWDGRQWKEVGPGRYIERFGGIAARDGHVFASGDFRDAGGIASQNIAHWTPCALDSASCAIPDGPCGDADADDDIDTTDALRTLAAAVGLGSCPLLFCDVNASDTISVADAFQVLRAAVQLPATLDCRNPL